MHIQGVMKVKTKASVLFLDSLLSNNKYVIREEVNSQFNYFFNPSGRRLNLQLL